MKQLRGEAVIAGDIAHKAHLRIGDTLTVRVTVKSIDGPRMILTTLCLVGDKVVVSGEATAILPRRRKPPAETA